MVIDEDGRQVNRPPRGDSLLPAARSSGTAAAICARTGPAEFLAGRDLPAVSSITIQRRPASPRLDLGRLPLVAAARLDRVPVRCGQLHGL